MCTDIFIPVLSFKVPLDCAFSLMYSHFSQNRSWILCTNWTLDASTLFDGGHSPTILQAVLHVQM